MVKNIELDIEGMDCSDCALVIEHSVGRLEGVLSTSVSYPTQKMRVEFDSRRINQGVIERRVRSLGYSLRLNGVQSWFHENRELLYSLASGVLLLAGWLGQILAILPPVFSLALYITAYILGGWDITRHALLALRQREFDTDLLMLMAALGAAALGQFSEGALLIFLFSLGHALEERALGRARSAIQALANLTPKTALVRHQGVEIELPVDQVLLDDVVIVRLGMRLPVDGVVLSGESAVDQAPVTGESIPVDKVPGDKVFAGSVNGSGALEVRATRLAKDSTLARVMRMVEEAQTQKSPTQQTVERFTRIYVPLVLVVTVLVAFVPLLFGIPFHASFMRAMILLVAASPCALALGTPAAILSGIGQAARNGVLVKGGVHLENLGRLKAIAFDKTGTLTRGTPAVSALAVFPDEDGNLMDENDLLILAAAAESRSGHPLAQAIVRTAQSRGLALPIAVGVEAQVGHGISSTVADQPVLVGTPGWVADAGVAISAEAYRQIETFQGEGRTVMAVAHKQQLVGLIALADELRPETPAVLRELKDAGVQEMVMLTGDNSPVAEAIARQAGLTHVRSELMPEDKLATIRELTRTYGIVAMVGDGINDAPALANATVGIAMGGSCGATDVALETADVALIGGGLSRLPFAVGLGRATRIIILQNMAVALVVITTLVVTSLLGLAGMGAAIFIHEGSTLVVVANALRLLNYRKPVVLSPTD